MIQNQVLSPLFALSEFTKRATDCINGIKNEPAPEQVENLKALCVHTLEPLCEALGLPIIISGYRTKQINHLLVNHSVKSQHMNGQTADFYVGWNGPKNEEPSRRELLMYNTTEARTRQAIFKMVQMHMKHHLRTIRQTITNKSGSPSDRYFSLNYKALSQALQALVELYVNGQDVTITDVEQAINDYAAEHPTSIKIASKSGYQDVYLTGPWPDTITLNALAGDHTVIIIVAENGPQTTINADGTVTTGQYSGGNSNTNTGGNTNTGDNTGGGTDPDPSTGGGDNTGNNSDED